MNLLDGVKSLIGTQGIETLAGMLGENAHNTQMAANSGVASILATMMQSAASGNGSGASTLLNLITSGGHNGDMLSNVAGLLSGKDASGLSGLLTNGGGLLTSLLGNKSSGIADLIGSIAGIKSSSASSLMSLAAPLLLNLVGKNVGNGGASGLMSLLMGQQDAVKAALPTGISNMLGFGNFDAASALKGLAGGATSTVTAASEQVRNTVNTAADEVTTAAEGGMNWLPWIIGALGILAALWYFKGCGDKANQAKDAAVAAAAKAKMTADSLKAYTEKMAADAANALSKFTLPGGVNIEFEKGSIEDDMTAFISDKAAAIDKNKWFNFEGLNFDTGKATLKAGSEKKLENVAAIMKAFPAVKIKVGGYTDNVGNAASNQKLSAERAKTVMAELVKRGVEAARMEAEGYGQEHPVGDNATDEGKAKNRRIDISVRAK